ncbi:hypothetical protein K488DRAFT_67972 [Vararia minispora EC-137]|uniref:Uncharacterized protein n=1 Tax=Vararia minispora EC-137 TaxID=1314806 RepID=A0ACB8QWY1_9AGAM|nr:hypothetical protein K488DRAFT_67972 [Vararia minispora EC-137]
MSSAPQTTQSSVKQQPAKQSVMRSSKEKQQQAQPKESKPTSPPSVAKQESSTSNSRRGRTSLPTHLAVPPEQQKKITRRSSKPIFDWFQRKLAGTVRARRASESARTSRGHGATGASGRDKKRPPLPDNFHALTRTQSTPSRGRSSGERNIRRRSHAVDSPVPQAQTIQGTVSLDDDSLCEDCRESSTCRSSLARESLWSPTSNLEADEDASVRPLPPSSPPSPSPSHSSSSYLSDPRTFRSLAASTKPTTLLSVDLTNGMAHIAQAPPTPSSTFPRFGSHSRTAGGSTSSAAPIHFSSLPTGHSPSHSVSGDPTQHLASAPPVQAPQLTHYHPRNNPRPSSPPPDNASVLTLASSAFGIPGARPGIVASADAMSVSQFSHFGGSRGALEDRSSHFMLGDDFEADRDADASVRALRPRSRLSRRGSWESEASGWSAKMGHNMNGSTVALSPGTPLHDRGLFWAASVKTGDFDDSASIHDGSQLTEHSPSEMQSTAPLLPEEEADAASTTMAPTPRRTGCSDGDVDDHEADAMKDVATPRHAPAELEKVEAPPLPTSISSDSADTSTTAQTPRAEAHAREAEATTGGDQGKVSTHQVEGSVGEKYLRPSEEGNAAIQSPDARSIAASETTDVYVSAPSTPQPAPSLPVGTPAAA